MRAYLSGGMEYVNGEGRSWREEMEEWLLSALGWECFNPNRNSDELLARRTPDVPFRTLTTEHGLGGNLVLRLGHRYPERFERLAPWAPGSANPWWQPG